MPDTPFDGIEGALEYVHLLGEAIEEARAAIREDITETAAADDADRRLDALRLVDYKLAQLGVHVTGAGRLLNDLRTLRRLLLGERDDTT